MNDMSNPGLAIEQQVRISIETYISPVSARAGNEKLYGRDVMDAIRAGQTL